MKKSIAVLGLGMFGKSLVRSLSELGADVLAVDVNETNVKEVADFCSEAVCADLANEESLKELVLRDMDTVVVSVGRNLEASIFSVAAAKEQGVPYIVAKSSSDRMSSILRKIGADRVIMPEEYAGKRAAAILVMETMLDYFQVDDNLCMVEMMPLSEWVGKTPSQLNIRKAYDANVVARKDDSGIWMMIDPEQPLKENNELLVVVERRNLGRLKGK